MAFPLFLGQILTTKFIGFLPERRNSYLNGNIYKIEKNETDKLHNKLERRSRKMDTPRTVFYEATIDRNVTTYLNRQEARRCSEYRKPRLRPIKPDFKDELASSKLRTHRELDLQLLGLPYCVYPTTFANKICAQEYRELSSLTDIDRRKECARIPSSLRFQSKSIILESTRRLSNRISKLNNTTLGIDLFDFPVSIATFTFPMHHFSSPNFPPRISNFQRYNVRNGQRKIPI